eukprot:11143742-Alexandrium_andersonii.AAC.1
MSAAPYATLRNARSCPHRGAAAPQPVQVGPSAVAAAQTLPAGLGGVEAACPASCCCCHPVLAA